MTPLAKNQNGQTSTPNESDVVSANAESILQCLQKVVNHDLPNQLIAVRGWINLLQSDELDRLSESGRSYVQRLIASTDRVQRTVELLAEMGRLSTRDHSAQSVLCSAIISDVQKNVEQRENATKILWELAVQPVYICADGRIIANAISELVCLIVRHPSLKESTAGTAIRVGAQRKNAGVDLWVKSSNEILEKEIGKRLEYLFANETAMMFGGTFEIQTDDSGVDVFRFHFPGYTAAE